jgi:hypothetical protein
LDENEKEISEYATTIRVKTIVQEYKYQLKQGLNFVSFPFLNENVRARSAAGMIEMLNDFTNNGIYSIAKYSGTWKIVGENAVIYDSNDFQLIPGEGYVIKAKKDLEVSIIGRPIQLENEEDHAPILFNVGWNLVGLYGSNVQQYTAESLIDSINRSQTITTDNVTKWDNSIQKYEGLQKNIENGVPMVYGFDFPIQLQSSYFVKVINGTGNWEPEIGK